MQSSKNVIVVSPNWAARLCEALRRAHSADRVETLGVDPTALRHDLPRIARALRASGQGPHEVYFLGAALERPFDPDDDAAVRAGLDAGALALATLLRGLHEAELGSFSLKLMTTAGHTATPLDAPHPCAAAAYGVLRTYAREFRGARVYCEDRSFEDVASLDLDPWARALAERAVAVGLEEVAIRGSRPLRRALERVHLDDADAPPLRAGGVYLVLGGAGGIGLELSKCLARDFRANLIWVGRSALDAERRRRLAEVEGLGGRVLYFAADVCDEAAMRHCVAQATRELGPIEGAFHSALILDDRPLVRLDEASMRKVLGPKTTGSLSLWRALRDQPLAFLTFFSSSQFLAANPGQANYAAGSAFMDAFADWLGRRSAYPVRTINWGYWGSVGAVASESYRSRFEALGVYSIEPEQGIGAVMRVLSNPVAQVLAFNGSEEMFLKHGLLEDAESRVLPAGVPCEMSLLDAPFPKLEPRRAEGDLVQAHVCDLVLFGLQGLGALRAAGQPFPLRSSSADHGVVPKHERLWNELVRMLTRAGHIEVNGHGSRAARHVRPLDRAELERRGRELRERAPEFGAVLDLAELCAIDLPRVLTGEKPATDVIFPRSSVKLVEAIYTGNPVSDYCNGIVAEAVRRRLELHVAHHRSGGEQEAPPPLRILEVGAGTGGTSRPLLGALAPLGRAVEYVYTDASRAFLIHGRKHYGHHPFVRFEICDVTADLAAQGFAPGSFDVVVATNVLHATPRMSATLSNLKTALCRGGWIIVNEATALRGFSTLIFGLLDGWWAFEDGDRRIPGSPLLSVEQWDRALRGEGFRAVRVLGEAPDELPLEQHVMVGESDGVVRVRRSPSAIDPSPVARGVIEPEPSAPDLAAHGEPSGDVPDRLATVVALVGRVLDMSSASIDPDETFADLGVDSVLAVEIASQLSEETGAELRSTDLFNYPSIRHLAGYLAGQTNRALEEESRREPAAPAPLLPLVTAVIARVLELDAADIGVDDVFADLGVDSILAVEIATQLGEALGREVRTSDLFSHGSARALAAALTVAAPAASRAGVTRPGAAPRAASAPVNAIATSDFPSMDLFGRSFEPAREIDAADEASGATRPRDHAAEGPSVTPPASPRRGARDRDPRIAIVGASGRFPGARDIGEFWGLMRAGRSAVREAPERWDLAAFYGTDAPSPPAGFRCRAGFLDDVLRFDALFFGMAPKEVELMDPQQRLVVEEGFRALEDAGYSRELLKRRKCGAYIGSGNVDYLVVLQQLGIVDDPSLLTGNVGSILASRLSYLLDLTGPAVAVDTACSSSLVAIHLACEALRAGAVEMALAGGVSVLNTPGFSLLAHRAGMLSPDGACKTFDHRANGMVPGEGVGMLVLKRLDDALRDGDHVHAVIVGSGVNQDGRTNGITAPSAISQAALEAEVYETYGIDPESIDYVECHGTGTKLGDPIEVQALTDAFRRFTARREFCALGSVKTNIGHTLSSAGVAGVLKVLLSLRHEELPPSLHFEQANEHIDFSSSPFFVQRALAPFPQRRDRPRRCAVSSFGFSGTNAHLVLEEGPAAPTASPSAGALLFVLSARTRAALSARARDLAAWIAAEGASESAARVAYTLLCRRTHHAVRWAIAARDLAELRAVLEGWSGEGGPGAGILRELPEARAASSALESELGRYLARELPRSGPEERRQKLEALAELFAKGVDFDWLTLFSDRRTVSLPTYPFEGERHWPASRRGGANVRSAPDKPSRAAVPFLLRRTWTASPRVVSPAPIAGRWVVLVGEGSAAAGARLRDRFGSGGAAWDIVEIGRIEAAGPQRAVEIAELAHGGSSISGVIDLADLWPADRRAVEGHAERLAYLQALVRGWLDRGGSSFSYLHLTAGTSGPAGPEPCFRGAFFAGLPAVLAAEHRGVRAQTVDVDHGADQIDRVLDIIAGELASADDDIESSWRRGVRHVPALEDARAVSGARAASDGSEGYWVVTGATGGIGALLAKEWAARGARRLALLVHRPLPPRHGWRAILDGEPSSDADREIAARIRAIDEIEARGASVLVYEGSLRDGGALSSFFERCQRQWGAMKGVLHCAGAFVEGQHAFARRDLADARRVLEPKVEGLLSLYAAAVPFDPEQFVLFSSIAAVCPRLSAGIGDYALANGFMNRFAELTHRQGARVQVRSIAWSNWDAVGFGKVESSKFIELGLVRHSPEQGLALLDEALRTDAPVLLAGASDPARWDISELLRARRPPASPVDGAASGAARVEAAAVVDDARRRGIAWLRALFARELHLPEGALGENVSFQDFGVDSILMVELIKRIEGDLRGDIDPAVFLEHPTLARLSAHLSAAHSGFAELVAARQAFAAADGAAPGEPVVVALSPPEDPAPAARPDRSAARSRAIAVIGVGCHFPGARGPDAFWQQLRAGYDGIEEVPRSRWDTAQIYAPRHAPGRSISKWGGFLEGIELFDPSYFGLPEAMAPQIDPLIRQLLEVSADCVADAGYRAEELAGQRAGVFIGARTGNYGQRIDVATRDTALAVGQNFIAAHVSHFLDLRGPALVIDSACSSSLVSLHMACQSLRAGECDFALAGGVDLLLDESPYLTLSVAKALSPNGRCFTFDAKADGFVPGEGAGVVLLTPLDRALARGDRVYAIIEGSAINNDGRTMGITTPNPDAQSEVIRAALADADVAAASLSYVEAHGTGTMIGDPIELKALTGVFRETTSDRQFCPLGSVKSNIGHLMSAAGIASVIKTVLCLKHGELVPSINCDTPNQRFAFADSPFYVGTRAEPWPLRHGTRRAGVSSFGFGGTNAHAVLAQPPAEAADRPTAERRPLGLVQFARRRYWLERALSSARLPDRSGGGASMLELRWRATEPRIDVSASQGNQQTQERTAGGS